MHMRKNFLGLALTLSAISAAAQVTGSGTSGTVPQFTGGSSIGNSPISISGSNVGIGTTAPLAAFHVNAQGSANGGGTATSVFGSFETGFGSASNTAVNGALMFPGSGWLNGWLFYYPHMTNSNPTFRFTAQSSNVGDFPPNVVIDGNVGIGTMLPGAKLEVSGSVKLTAGTGASMTYADGTVQSTAWTGVLSGGDYAESVDIAAGRDSIGPGDLVVIDAGRNGQFLKSTEAYSTLISGVYATKPGVVGRRQPRDKSSTGEVPMAMIGIVPTKVSTENGPIHRGDLLVSAPTPGFAMKGTDRGRMMGAVIGKALAPLETGSGVIEVLISLQ